MRHSAAHLLAHAVMELFPKTILTIGPPTKAGFFYDFLPKENFKLLDLPKIEAKMHEIAARNLPITHEQMPKEQARKLFKDNPFKLELIEQIPGDTVGIATQGDFIDLCKGGHVDHTGKIKHFKLTGISGSYWRADRNGQALQRIAGTAFLNAKDLRTYEKRVEEARKYDHRKLGKQLDLFSFHDEGVGFPFFHPKGKSVIQLLKDYMRHLLNKYDYLEIQTPTMLSVDLWKQSGHYNFYKDNMYFSEIDEKQYAIKPMNCPGAIMIYKERPHSFRELPIRTSEFGNVHRYELSGALHGLFRARAFTQDDSHIFCTPEQIEDEVYHSLLLAQEVFSKFGFNTVRYALSTKPEKSMGSEQLWDKATQALANALKKANINYTVDEGEGAFYGPKIDMHIKDSMDRDWQCGTIQLDFFLPQNFNLEYVTSGDKREQPVMIHRAIYGSLERFFAILLEHFKGKLPFFIAPVQIKILTITDEQVPYAKSIFEKLKKNGYRVQLDASSDQISTKIKKGQIEQVPWMLIIGQKEVDNKTIALRYLSGKQEFGLSLEKLLEKANEA